MFCDSCGRKSGAVAKNASRKIQVRNAFVEISYTAQVCPYCGEELYDETVENQLLVDANEAYKRQSQLLAGAAIIAWMKKNSVTGESLAQRINCSVSDIIRCTRGGIQSQELDGKLRGLMTKSA